MNRFRTPLIVLGLVGAVVVGVAVVLVVRAGRGTPVELPVAIADIPPGRTLEPQLFRLEAVRGLEGQTLEAYVMAGDFAQVAGLETLETVHAGFPLGWAQVCTDEPNARQGRLTLLLDDPAHLVYPLPVSADQVGNYLVAGDYVDVVFSLGRAAAAQIEHVEELEPPEVKGMSGPVTPTVPLRPVTRAGETVTTTLNLPLAKVILGDVHVLRVEREAVRAASATYGTGATAEARTTEGDVVRLYVELDEAQAEVLSFALHNGSLNLPARAQPLGGETQGYAWDDFVDDFFSGRPEEELRGER